MASNFRQDMPPEGGYSAIRYERVLPKRMFNRWIFFWGMIPLTVWGWYQFLQAKKMMRKYTIEKYNSLLACEPFIQAEKERAFLKQLHKLRKDETELMKNVPGWTVGSYYGVKTRKTDPEDGALPHVSFNEYYAHRHPHEQYNWQWPDKNID